MNKLFLASVACNVLDRFIDVLDCDPSRLKVAFIPTAGDIYENKKFLDDDRNKLLELGFKVFDVNIAGMSEDDLEKDLGKSDVIFVAGGNTFYLLEKSIQSGFVKIAKKLIQEGRYYIGSSAGSVLAGSSIELVKYIDDPKKGPSLSSYDGLGFVNKVIIPHYGNKKYVTLIDKALKNYSDIADRVVKLSDKEALVVCNNTAKIVSQSHA